MAGRYICCIRRKIFLKYSFIFGIIIIIFITTGVLHFDRIRIRNDVKENSFKTRDLKMSKEEKTFVWGKDVDWIYNRQDGCVSVERVEMVPGDISAHPRRVLFITTRGATSADPSVKDSLALTHVEVVFR